MNLETVIRDGKVMQDFGSELAPLKGDHSQKVKDPFNGTNSGSKDRVNLPSPIAVSRLKKIPFTQAQFIASVFVQDGFPKPVNLEGTLLPEIVLAGRSNVGKSSLINNLLRNKTLAKTSSTPGKTQSVNFFTVNDQLTLVDLPGYGYAKTCKKIRKTWAPLIDAYLEERSNLKLVLLLIDSRRELNEEDQALIDWALFRQIPLLLIFTKSDKLNTSEKVLHKRQFSYLPNLYYSIKDPAARIALIETINLQLHTHGTYQ